MYDKPKDVPGECNARLYLADDFGDGTCTIRCQLLPNHEGLHQEITGSDPVTITWQYDQREIELELTIDETKFDGIVEKIWEFGMVKSDKEDIIIIICNKDNVDKFSTIDGVISVKNMGFEND